MSLLNLSLAQFLGLFVAGAGILVALYLLDRTRRRQVVATLRFFSAARNPVQTKHRRRIRQPWSLALQIIGFLLLLLAVGRPQIGGENRTPADHVVLVDTSAWMTANAGTEPLIAQARRAALRYLEALPPTDRVMLVRAEALPTPAAPFESDREKLRNLIRSLQPGATSLNLPRALEFASNAIARQSRRPGEIVLITGGRMQDPGAAPTAQSAPPNFRVIQLESPLENAGIRRIGLRHPPDDPDSWEAFVSVRNYGTKPRTATLGIQYAGAPAGAQRWTIAPGEDKEATLPFRATAAGWLEVRLLPDDAFPDDNYARLEIPERQTIRVAVFSPAGARLRPFFASSPLVSAEFYTPGQFDSAPKADLYVFDRCRPAAEVPANTIWLQPPAADSPVSVRSVAGAARLESWTAGHPLTAGLEARDVRFGSTQIYTAENGFQVIGRADDGPVVLANPATHQLVVGFDPAVSTLRYDLTAPLLLANAMRWMHPELFRQWELTAGSAGFVTTPVPAEVEAADVTVRDEDGRTVPFTQSGENLQFFTADQGTFQVDMGMQRVVFSLTLPETGETVWTPPATAKRGIPPSMSFAEQARDVWWILVLLGAGCLIAEWLLYGRKHGLPQTSAGPGLPAGDLFPAEAAAQPAEQRRAS